MTDYKIGQIFYSSGDIILNEGKEERKLIVKNMGDRPIQVGSHFHFFEVNKYLEFDRKAAYGFHLDIPSGTAVRFEPGEEKEVDLTEYEGAQIICGFNGLTMGQLKDEKVREAAFAKAKGLGFRGI